MENKTVDLSCIIILNVLTAFGWAFWAYLHYKKGTGEYVFFDIVKVYLMGVLVSRGYQSLNGADVLSDEFLHRTTRVMFGELFIVCGYLVVYYKNRNKKSYNPLA